MMKGKQMSKKKKKGGSRSIYTFFLLLCLFVFIKFIKFY